MKIQHWFFFKRHPEKIPKIAKKPLKSVKVTKAVDDEQQFLDACWNKNTLNKKLRNKIIKRIERVKEIKKTQYPLSSRTARPTNKAVPNTKGMGKRNMSSVVLLIQESNKRAPSRLTTSRNSIRPGLGCNTPQVNAANYSFAGRVSTMDNCMNSSRVSRDGHNTGRESSRTFKKDNSAYEALRDQLQKITLKLDMEGIKSNDVSEWRQRRTRKERSDRNANLTNGSSLLIQSQSSIPLQSYNEEKIKEYHTQREKKIEGLKRPLTRNEVAYKVANNALKTKPTAKLSKNASTVVINKSQNHPSKKVLVGVKKTLDTKGVVNTRNAGKKSIQQKENIQVNKIFKTTVA